MNAGAYTTCDVRWHNNNDSSSNVQRFIDFHSIYYIDIIIFVTYWCCRRTYNSYIVYTQTEQYICLGFFLNSFMRTKPIEMYFFGIFLSCLWISTLLCAKFNFLGLWRLLLHPSPHMDIILLRQTASFVDGKWNVCLETYMYIFPIHMNAWHFNGNIHSNE